MSDTPLPITVGERVFTWVPEKNCYSCGQKGRKPKQIMDAERAIKNAPKTMAATA